MIDPYQLILENPGTYSVNALVAMVSEPWLRSRVMCDLFAQIDRGHLKLSEAGIGYCLPKLTASSAEDLILAKIADIERRLAKNNARLSR